MVIRNLVAMVLSIVFVFASSVAQAEPITELNPFDPNVEETLKAFDKVYEEETGLPAHIDLLPELPGFFTTGCYRQSCEVWARVVKAEQRLYLYLDGQLSDSWLVSTGAAGFGTPNFDRHPNGRIYTKYTSTKYPDGDYMGLGNMPYAVFISGGFALHGTPEGNWKKLGRRASHGCIRQHPDNAEYFNSLVRSAGIRKVWITVE